MKTENEELFISKIIDFLSKADVFSNKPKIKVDYLGDKIDNYSLEAVPAERILHQFIDGSKEKQKIFVFASRKTYSQDDIENLENYKLFENLAEWIEQQNDEENYPDVSEIENIEEIETIEIMDSPYIAAVSETEARYQMEIKITYLQK